MQPALKTEFMTEKKYIYNPKTLSYELEKPSIKNGLKLGGIVLFFSLMLSVVFTFVFTKLVDSPEEVHLKVQNIKLHAQLTLIDQKLDSINTYLNQIQEKDDHLYRVLLGESPLEEDIRLAGIGGSIEPIDENDEFQMAQRNMDIAKARLAVQNSSFDEMTSKALLLADEMNSTPRIMPIRENDLIRFASEFGYRTHPIFGIRKFHKGIDLTAARGTTVYAAAPGEVVIASNEYDGYGNKVVIDHGNGYKTVYAHLSHFNVKRGQKVKLATKIGEVGSTGRSIASHLHYEVRINDQPVNPANYLYRDFSDEEFDELVALASKK